MQAHHPSYEVEDAHLKVVWLCQSCHALEHGVRDWTKQVNIRFPKKAPQQLELFFFEE